MMAIHIEGSSNGAHEKPMILVDVGNTLWSYDTYENGMEKLTNNELINLLNAKSDEGFKVQIVTGGLFDPSWLDNFMLLRDAGLKEDILRTAMDKCVLDEIGFSGVVAIIDDRVEPYIEEVQKKNSDAKHFLPNQINELNTHLGNNKPKAREVGE